MRATSRYAPGTLASTTTAPAAAAPGGASSTPGIVNAPGAKVTPASTGPITSTGPMHRLLEGTLIDTVLTNRLDGTCGRAGQLSRHQCRLLARRTARADSGGLSRAGGNEARPELGRDAARRGVQSPGAARWSHLPPRSVPGAERDRRRGSPRPGEPPLLSTFGASAAVGLITGFAQCARHRRVQPRRRRSNRRHRRQRRRCHVAGDGAEHEPVAQPTAHHHDSRGAPGEGLSHERSRAAGV